MTSARLQRDAEVQRAGLSNTLGQLRDGMTAQALSAEMMGVARDTSLSLVKSLAESAKANPGAALLIGAGLTMLLTRTTGADVMSTASSALKAATAAGTDAAVSAAGGVGRAAGAVAGTASSLAGRAKDTVADAAGKLGGTVSETAASLRDKAAGTVDSLRHTVAGTADQVRGTVEGQVDQAVGQAKEMLHDGQDRARQLEGEAAKVAAEAKQVMTRFLEEQPILVAAIGTAIGALFGAALPVSQAERSVLGKVGAEAVSAGREALDKAKDVVSDELASAHLGEKVDQVAGRLVDTMVPTGGRATG
ncbi:MAG: hypothetical protein PS018_24255 [bacterium]|nr:hypothetical protein [bacterium]